MRTAEVLVAHIYYVNHLWHISLATGDPKAGKFFLSRKTALQNQLLADYGPLYEVVPDDEASFQLGREVLLVRSRDQSHTACHITPDSIEENGSDVDVPGGI